MAKIYQKSTFDPARFRVGMKIKLCIGGVTGNHQFEVHEGGTFVPAIVVAIGQSIYTKWYDEKEQIDIGWYIEPSDTFCLYDNIEDELLDIINNRTPETNLLVEFICKGA